MIKGVGLNLTVQICTARAVSKEPTKNPGSCNAAIANTPETPDTPLWEMVRAATVTMLSLQICRQT